MLTRCPKVDDDAVGWDDNAVGWDDNAVRWDDNAEGWDDNAVGWYDNAVRRDEICCFANILVARVLSSVQCTVV